MTPDPKRLTVVGATDLERSLLQAARRERPSPELTARMAAGLGISVAAAAGTAAAATTAATAPAVSAAPAAAAVAAPAAAMKTAMTAWLSASVLAVGVAAGVVGVRLSAPHDAGKAGDRAAPVAVAPRVEEAPIAIAPSPAGPAAVADRRTEKTHRRLVPAAPAVPAGDLRDQIALIDAARGAVKAGATDRALVLLRRYETNFPGGAFRPEALALRIEALDAGGRDAEAQTLARDFLARYPQSPVADRVARIARK